MKTRLSVNINKVALIRNARGDNYPNLLKFAKDCERFGAEGITVHPRPDERHVRFDDLMPLKEIVTTEFNIEGYPSEKFVQEVIKVKPHQCTLVPDKPEVLTSSEGWDTINNKALLAEVIKEFKSNGIRVSLFMETDPNQIEGAKNVDADRIELYTGRFAKNYGSQNSNEIMTSHAKAAKFAHNIGMGINAGHDLNLDNLKHYNQEMPFLDEVSIGHALITDSLYYGISNTIKMYLHLLQ